jgi:DNA-binding beta-propeller fold protein YncE
MYRCLREITMKTSKRFRFITALGLAALAQFCLPVAHADLLVTNIRGLPLQGNILRFDQATGAFIDAFVPNAGLQPLDMTIGPDGNLYVTSGLSMSDDPSDPGAFSVRRYDRRTGAFIDVFAIGGLLDFPQGLVFGPDGNLYVGNQQNPFSGANGVLRYDGRTGAFLDVFASTGSPSLYPSLGLAFGPDGNLYLAVSDNVSPGFGQVRRYDGRTGAFLDVFASDARLRDTRDFVFGPGGNLYVASTAGSVFRFDGRTGAFLDIFARLPAGGAAGLIFGPDGNLYVASNGPNQVVRFDGTTGAFLDVFIPPGTGGLDAPISLLFFTSQQVIFAGTPGTPNCHGKSVSALVHEFGGLKAAASALGFPSVQALHDAIRAFCRA